MPADPILGQIMPAPYVSVIPKGWALCDGTPISVQLNQALFSLIGTTYGGDGVKTFNLPDLRGRAIMGSGSTTNGTKAGSVAVALSADQLPSHTHWIGVSTSVQSGKPPSPKDRLFAANSDPGKEYIYALTGSAEVPLAESTNVAPAGGGLPHDNMQPYLAINYMIALEGTFPSRG